MMGDSRTIGGLIIQAVECSGHWYVSLSDNKSTVRFEQSSEELARSMAEILVGMLRDEQERLRGW